MATVWAVNGAKFSADSARAESFKATSGRRGVVLPGDLKVSALPVPGAFVRVAPGGASMPAGYPQAPGQSYGTYQAVSEDVPVTATGSGSPVIKYLIQRVTDPQFEGQPPADPVNARYDSFQWVTTLTGLNYPYVPLARLTQPASTATVTAAMLTDIRKLIRSQTERYIYVNVPPTTDLTSTSYTIWPEMRPSVEIPEWATHVNIAVRVTGFRQVNGITHGGLRVRLGNAVAFPAIGEIGGAQIDYDFNDTPTAGNGLRHPTFSAVMYEPLPAAMKGTTQQIRLEGFRQASEPGYLRTDIMTQVEFDVWFTEKTV